jgi:hypothetical protein
MKQIFTAAIMVAIGLAILTTIHHASAQYPEFPDYGSSYYPTPQERYNSGWNHGLAAAILDFNDGGGYNNWSPGTHTIYYFLGFHDGYRAEWYSINYPQQYPVPTQNQQTINNYISIYGNGNTVTTDNEQGNNQGS